MPDTFKTYSVHPDCRVCWFRSSLRGLAWLWVLLAGMGAGSVYAQYEPIEILYDQSAGENVSSEWVGWLGGGFVVLLGAMLGGLYRHHRRRIEQLGNELEQAEFRLREAQLIARIGSWNRDFETGETFWSEEACKVLGLLGREYDYKHYERLIHPDDVERVTEVVATAYYQGGAYQCDHRVICPDGMEKFIRLAGQVSMGDDQSPVRETGTVQDITQQHLAETAIQRSEQRLRSILDATPYPILIIENAEFFPVLYANRSTYSLFKIKTALPVEDIRLQALWSDGAELSRFAASVTREGSASAQEALFTNADGKNFWGELSGSSMDYSGVDALFVTLADITERRRIHAELERMATTDALTGSLNRRSFLTSVQRELRRSVRYRHTFTLLMMDIDHFKRVNDNYGHAFGDAVIRRFCEIAQSCLREEDLFGRIGGEEFGSVLVSSEEDGGYLVAERIRKRWQDEGFEIQGARCNFTVSIGVAQLQSDKDSVEEVMERADKGLYGAKRAGRNCVIVYSGDRPQDAKQTGPV